MLEAVLNADLQYRLDEYLHDVFIALVLGQDLNRLYEVHDLVGELAHQELEDGPLLPYVAVVVVGDEEI